MPRFGPATLSDSPQWATPETNFQNNPFTFTSWPTNDNMFNTTPQRNWHSASFDTPERPATLRNSSSYSLQEESRRASAQDVGFGAFVGTPRPSLKKSVPRLHAATHSTNKHQTRMESITAPKRARQDVHTSPQP